MKLYHKATRKCVLLLSIFVCIVALSCRRSNQNFITDNTNQTTQDSLGFTEDSLSFIVLGDWGRDGQFYQQAVADQMAIIAKKFHTRFVITTGDNFYSKGVTGPTDPHWTRSFENVYHQKTLQVSWYPTLGNHDYGTDPDAQVEYSTISKRWHMPARYYSLTQNIDSAHSVLLAFTDTSPFVSGYYSKQMADLQKQDTAAQRIWLRQLLTNSHDTWKIVVGHHPLFSSGPHGNTPELIERFEPVFQNTNTDFYLCGHDHSLQYLVQPNDPVQYIISGGGSETTKVTLASNNRFAQSAAGFVVMTLYARKAHVYYYDSKGNMLYQQQVNK